MDGGEGRLLDVGLLVHIWSLRDRAFVHMGRGVVRSGSFSQFRIQLLLKLFMRLTPSIVCWVLFSAVGAFDLVILDLARAVPC
jgi:hypothetical protein